VPVKSPVTSNFQQPLRKGRLFFYIRTIRMDDRWHLGLMRVNLFSTEIIISVFIP